jgi:hypothetical protein
MCVAVWIARLAGDTRAARAGETEAEAFAFLNDQEQSVGGDVIEALSAYGVVPAVQPCGGPGWVAEEAGREKSISRSSTSPVNKHRPVRRVGAHSHAPGPRLQPCVSFQRVVSSEHERERSVGAGEGAAPSGAPEVL